MMYEIPQSSRDVPGLEDYLRAVRERWIVIAGLALVGVLLALLFTATRVEMFEAEARVVINPTNANATNQNLVPPNLEREREVVASIDVVSQGLQGLSANINRLDVAEDLDVSFINDSDTLSVAYESTDPSIAETVVNRVTEAYVDRREAASIGVISTQIEELQANAAVLTEQLETTSAELGAAQARRTTVLSRPATDPARAGLLEEANEAATALTTRRTIITNDISAVSRDLRAFERDLAAREPTAAILQPASVPESPSNISRNLLLAIGLVLGSLAGAALAFTLQRLDRTARGSLEIEAALGTGVLGSIPNYGVNTRRSLMMLGQAKGARQQRVREAYRRVRASLAFLQTTEDAKSFIVTSARPGEGKSSIAANVAIAAAQAGSSVALISADLRRPTQEEMFGVKTDVGLSDHLRDPKISNIMVAVPGVPGLVIVPAGALPPNPGELLISPEFRNLVTELKDQFDIVIIDTPPVLNTADAASSSPLVDGVLIVVDGKRTDTDELVRVRASLENAGGKIVGAILNRDQTDNGVSLRKDRYSYERVANQR